VPRSQGLLNGQATFRHTIAIDTSREQREILRLRSSAKAQHRQEIIFLCIVALAAFFPPGGILALYGHFDATISWSTHGEFHELSRAQRRLLQLQLLVECVLYPTLIISLAVYFAVSK
jgi:hypothetical protein